MTDIVISRRGYRSFRLPDGHRAEVTGGSVILEAPRAGGRYVLEGLEDSTDSKQRVIYLGPLELGWWNGAPPGVPCEYPFPDATS